MAPVFREPRLEARGRINFYPVTVSPCHHLAQFVPVLRTLAGPFAGANLMPWRNFIFANAVSSCVWAASYGYAAYWVGGEFERLQGRMVLPLVFIAVIALVAGGLFVRQREAQLIIEAERAIPGSLELR